MIDLGKWFGKESTVRTSYKNKSSAFGFSKVRSIGFILDSVDEQRIRSCLRIADTWPGAKKSFLIFNRKGEESSKILASYFNNKSFDWLGRIKPGQLRSFLEEEFDCVLDYSTEYNPLINKTFPFLKTKMLIGSRPSESYDFTLNTDTTDLNEFERQLVKYLSLIH